MGTCHVVFISRTSRATVGSANARPSQLRSGRCAVLLRLGRTAKSLSLLHEFIRWQRVCTWEWAMPDMGSEPACAIPNK